MQAASTDNQMGSDNNMIKTVSNTHKGCPHHPHVCMLTAVTCFPNKPTSKEKVMH